MAQAAIWISKITTAGLMMVLPAVLGRYLDGLWGTEYLAIVGVVIGVTVGIWNTVRMASTPPNVEEAENNDTNTSGNQEENPPKDNRD